MHSNLNDVCCTTYVHNAPFGRGCAGHRVICDYQ